MARIEVPAPGFTAEQAQLRDAVRDFTGDRFTETHLRRQMDTDAGFEAADWTALAGMDLCGLAVPEKYGGAGCSFVEVGVVAEELGRVLAGVPYLSSVVLAQTLLLQADDPEAAERWLPEMVAGRLRGAVAVLESTPVWEEQHSQALAAESDGAWRISGTKTFVIDGATADLLLVAARTSAGVSVFAVESDSAGLAREAMTTLDPTRRLARLTLADTPATIVGRDGAGWAAVARMLEYAAVALAMESVGAAQQALAMSADYASERTQFGRAIGSFQAVKHKCAGMLLQVESARSVAYQALAEVDDPQLAALSSGLAAAYCPDAFFDVAAENIQVHGGIGFTWEHPAHLYFKRAKTNQLLLGDAVWHRRRLATRLGF